MSRNYLLFLDDIRASCKRITRHIGSMTQEEFLADEKTYDAVLRQLTLIGEAAKQIPQDVRERYPAVDWKGIGRFRDLVIHHYFGVDDKIVWNAASAEVPTLLADLTDKTAS